MKYENFIELYANQKNTDISSHLPEIYKEVYKMQPKTIVELGVRGGESSFVFSCINEELGSHVYGIDIDLCDYRDIRNGHFIQGDDCQVAKTFHQKIDVLMIDTSHLFDHTLLEITEWFPLLNERSLILFHDTNIDGKGYIRLNGTRGENWDNQRGVIRALEVFFGKTYDEKAEFEDSFEFYGYLWKLRHKAYCNGLMMIWKTPLERSVDKEVFE